MAVVKCVGGAFIKTKKTGEPMLILHTLVPVKLSPDNTRLGSEPKTFFIPLSDSEFIFGCNATQLSLKLFVDKELDITCDFSGRPASISVVGE